MASAMGLKEVTVQVETLGLRTCRLEPGEQLLLSFRLHSEGRGTRSRVSASPATPPYTSCPWHASSHWPGEVAQEQG